MLYVYALVFQINYILIFLYNKLFGCHKPAKTKAMNSGVYMFILSSTGRQNEHIYTVIHFTAYIGLMTPKSINMFLNKT